MRRINKCLHEYSEILVHIVPSSKAFGNIATACAVCCAAAAFFLKCTGLSSHGVLVRATPFRLWTRFYFAKLRLFGALVIYTYL